MLATDTDLEVLDGLAPAFDTHFNELAHTFLVETSKWVVVEHFRILVG